MSSWPIKDPDEKIIFGFNWAPALGDDKTIVGSEYELLEGSIVIEADARSGALTSATISGGEEGESCKVRNIVTLSTGEQWIEPGYLKVETR